jgi:hypothetical protein
MSISRTGQEGRTKYKRSVETFCRNNLFVSRKTRVEEGQLPNVEYFNYYLGSSRLPRCCVCRNENMEVDVDANGSRKQR